MKDDKSMKEKFLNAMEIPVEFLADTPRITLFGNKNVLIENYKGIVEYDENIVRLVNGICILGIGLRVEEINCDEIFVLGVITSIEFEEE